MKLPLALAAALLTPAALAGPAAYVHTPIVSYGEREIELKWGRAKVDGSHEHETVVGYGMGLKPWWFAEVNLAYEGASDQSTRYAAFELENIFQLTETGRHAFDVGLLLEIERPRDHSEGYEVKFGPLLQTEVGRVQLNGNLLLERHFRAAEPSETETLYEWQAKYRWRPTLEPGLQGFGEENSHILGPALFGKVSLGGRQALKYDAAWLAAASHAAPAHTVRVRLEYEF